MIEKIKSLIERMKKEGIVFSLDRILYCLPSIGEIEKEFKDKGSKIVYAGSNILEISNPKEIFDMDIKLKPKYVFIFIGEKNKNELTLYCDDNMYTAERYSLLERKVKKIIEEEGFKKAP